MLKFYVKVFLHLIGNPYVNEKQLLFDKQIFEKISQKKDELFKVMVGPEKELVTIDLIKEIFRDLIPDDAILLNEENIKKDNLLKIENIDSFPDVIFFSPKLYGEEKRDLISFQYSDYKILEKNEKFILVEYPQKKENDYFTIIILGSKEKNIKFVNGFLNFLFDIKEEDNIRLKIERKENDDIIEVIHISSNKGNFKFYCANIEKQSPKNKDIKQLKQFFDIEKVDFIVLNQNEFGEKFKETETFSKLKEEKFIFFASPNPFLKAFLLLIFIPFFAEKDKKDIFKFIIDKILSYYFDYDCIYSKVKNKEINIYYKITMAAIQIY